ncbi:aspartic proteinase CDR1-like [Eucalyptus grandis]|uniref:aspartic proteinase CDR1-like n=1 Tax=Eucalyptus grandis TaxID=71139 RepID=UPI00192E7D08|nr:aspartic proteinase CDR1-like [Eucalyptus grandis]
MATTMKSSYLIFLVIYIIIFISSYPANVATSKTTPAKPRGLAIKLIHRDSIQSPYYNPNATISERAERAINGSLARIRSLSKRVATPNDDDARAGLIPAGSIHGFLAKISIGTPPVPQLVFIDTGSDLLCGNLASEQVTFETSDEGTVKVPIEVLGCGHVNKYDVDGQESGVLGLGYGDGRFPTVVKQLGSKFSYCIGNIHDLQYQYNQLSLGNGVIMEGDSTTLEIYNGLYYLDLQGISVGEKKLQIDPLKEE